MLFAFIFVCVKTIIDEPTNFIALESVMAIFTVISFIFKYINNNFNGSFPLKYGWFADVTKKRKNLDFDRFQDIFYDFQRQRSLYSIQKHQFIIIMSLFE